MEHPYSVVSRPEILGYGRIKGGMMRTAMLFGVQKEKGQNMAERWRMLSPSMESYPGNGAACYHITIGRDLDFRDAGDHDFYVCRARYYYDRYTAEVRASRQVHFDLPKVQKSFSRKWGGNIFKVDAF